MKSHCNALEAGKKTYLVPIDKKKIVFSQLSLNLLKRPHLENSVTKALKGAWWQFLSAAFKQKTTLISIWPTHTALNSAVTETVLNLPAKNFIKQGMVDGSASKPALRQDIWLRKLTLI